MSEMIERVARTMGATLIPGSTTVSAEYVISAELIHRLASAALEAMREPTDAIIGAPEIEAAAIAICKHRCRPGEDWRMFWCKGDLRYGMLEDARAVLEHLK